jgi:protein-disulfide isomerase
MLVIVLTALGYGGWSYLSKDRFVPNDPLVAESTHTKGAANAPVSVVLFNDLLCDECKALAHEVLPELEREFVDTGVVRLAFRHYPMDSDRSLTAAMASECAAQSGRFWAMHDVLYGWRAVSTTQVVQFDLARQLALGAGVPPRAYDACMSSRSVMALVERDLLDAHAAGVTRAPAIFVNGAYVDGIVDYARLRAMVLNAAASEA